MAKKRPPLTVPLTPGMPMLPATCACGHKGKSQRPQYYQCGYCYYSACAAGNLKLARALEARAEKLRAEAETFKKKAKAFRDRHPCKVG